MLNLNHTFDDLSNLVFGRFLLLPQFLSCHALCKDVGTHNRLHFLLRSKNPETEAFNPIFPEKKIFLERF